MSSPRVGGREGGKEAGWGFDRMGEATHVKGMIFLFAGYGDIRIETESESRVYVYNMCVYILYIYIYIYIYICICIYMYI